MHEDAPYGSIEEHPTRLFMISYAPVSADSTATADSPDHLTGCLNTGLVQAWRVRRSYDEENRYRKAKVYVDH